MATERTEVERFNVNFSLSKNYDYLESRFIGTGSPSTTREEWATNVQRDALAAIVQRHDLLTYVSVGNGESVGRTRFEVMQSMIQPVGGSAVSSGSTNGSTNPS